MGANRCCKRRIGDAEDKRTMIRVNLLPVKQARRRSAGRTQLFVFGGLLLLMVMVFGLLWLLASSELSRVQKDVANLEQGVKAAKEEVKDAVSDE